MLQAGSKTPKNEREVEALLRNLPHFALLPDFEACLIARERLGSQSGKPVADQADTLFDANVMESVRGALARVQDRAREENNGGQLFLAATFDHFLANEPDLPPSEHPLLVALYIRSLSAAENLPSDPIRMAAALDKFGLLSERTKIERQLEQQRN